MTVVANHRIDRPTAGGRSGNTLQQSLSMDADAVVNVRMESSEIANGGSEVIAYGTAVRVE